jgi:hypothetical protein
LDQSDVGIENNNSGNTAINVENETRMAYRTDATDTTWVDSLATINTSTDQVSKSLLENGEFIMGASKAPIVYDIDDQSTVNDPISIIVSDWS